MPPAVFLIPHQLHGPLALLDLGPILLKAHLEVVEARSEDLETHIHPDTQTQRDENIQKHTHTHKQTETQRRADTKTHRLQGTDAH